MKKLLGNFSDDNPVVTSSLKKLFLDKLPLHCRQILAGSLEADLNVLAWRADEIMSQSDKTHPTEKPNWQGCECNVTLAIIDLIQTNARSPDPAGRVNHPSVTAFTAINFGRTFLLTAEVLNIQAELSTMNDHASFLVP
ncbi:unnamed protein product [Clavelina lepadiformis]|uniref:Uncharacterized protein n=1 Tax=Clavelina lepadiformis TaxID=159417 RepID=A0ABP0GI35_CLALP